MSRLIENRILIALTIVFLTVWFVTSLAYRTNAMSERTQYLNQANQSYAEKIILTIDRYSDFSNYLFLTLIDEQTTLLMAQANAEDSLIKESARTALYDHLSDSYETIFEFNFRQLHFHLPNGESFLRFHAPQTYGDNLLSARTSIRLANTELRNVQGFEEGRVYNGFRFVYPIFHEDIHVGSVEISISIATILDTLFVIEPSRTHNFNIKRSVVEDLVFDEFLENYLPSQLNEDYLFDNQVAQLFVSRRTVLEGESFQVFLRHIRDSVVHQMEAEQDFSFHVNFEGKNYTAHFVSIRNIDDVHVGYIFSVAEDQQFYELILRDRLAYAVIAVFFITTLSSTLVYAHDKERIREISRTDYLTKLSNRGHFIELSEKELARSLRLDLAMSIILFDIDHFKRINDAHGHFVGDDVLKGVSHILKTHLRKYDISARWGGEEFIILLPQTQSKEAVEVVKKIQRMLKIFSNEIGFSVTMSFGITSLEDSKDFEVLLKIADDKLYQAKESGRNQYVI